MMPLWQKILVLVFSFATASWAKDQEHLLRLPLAEAICPTSSFASWRPGHLHAGLDLSTFGRTGLPVVAVDSCSLWRIRIWNGGYGKALYLRLSNDMVAVYGHLSRYIPEVDSIVEARQDSLCKYEVELYFKPSRFRFSPGDTIGFTGETGSGPPHLHFELRSDLSGRLRINPLEGFLNLREPYHPEISRVIFEPLEAATSIDGRYTSKEIDRASLPDTISIAGSFGVSIEASDTTLCGRLIGVNSYSIEVDGNPIWNLKLDSFPSSESHFVDAIYEIVDAHRFVRLFTQPDVELGDLDCYPRDSSCGFSLLPGYHRLVIRVFDAWGNADSMTVGLRCGVTPYFASLGLIPDITGTIIEVEPRFATCVSVGFPRKGEGGGFTPKDSRQISDWEWLENHDVRSGLQRISLPVDSPTEVVCRLEGVGGIASGGILSTLPIDSSQTCFMDFHSKGTWIEVSASCDVPPLSLPALSWTHEESTMNEILQPLARCKFRGVIFPSPSDTLLQPVIEFRYVNRTLICSDTLRLLPVIPGDTTWFKTGQVVLRIKSREKNPKRFLKVSRDSSDFYKGFASRGIAIGFEPDGMFFPQGLEISVRLGSFKPHAGLFGIRNSNPFFVAGFDKDGMCHIKLTTLFGLAILEDLEPPSVNWERTISRKQDGRMLFRARVRDSGSGIDVGSLKASIDGDCAIPSYDPDTGIVSIRSRKRLPYGRHRIRLEVEDRLGNQTAIERLIDTGR